MSDLHAMQRAMRAMRRAATGRGVAAVLDIGSSKVACFVLRLDEPGRASNADRAPLARKPSRGGPRAERASDAPTGSAPRGRAGSAAGGQATVDGRATVDGGPMTDGRPMADGRPVAVQARVIGAAATRSRGVRFGEIATMRETEAAIRTVVQGAQAAAGERVDHVIASLAGGDPRSYGLSGVVMVKGEVREADVARAMAACAPPDLGPGRHVLHAQPVHFALDHRTGLADPRGQFGQRLFCDMHLMSVEARVARDLVACIKRCDLELAGLTSAAFASGLSALVEDERELGAACLDLGGGATAASIFVRGHMVFGGSVRMGGDHVTADIHKGLQIPLGTAERIKCVHGGLVATGLDDGTAIPLGGETGDWETDRRSVSRAELIGIMRPRVEEILEEARGLLDAAGLDALPSRKVVLTGGASQVPGLDALAGRILGAQVRLGRPLRLRGVPQSHTGPAFAALTGLCLEAAQPQDEWWDFAAPEDARAGLGIGRAVRWLRANW